MAAGVLALLALFFSRSLFCIFLVILFGAVLISLKYPGRFDARLKMALLNGALLVGSLFLIALGIESYLRLFQPKFLDLAVSISGDFKDFTQRGYLDDGIFSKPLGAYRILGLGDSFARNQAEIQKNYHNFLEQDFSQAGRNRVDIINAGIEGTGPGYYWRFLNKYGDRLQPDLVLAGFFIGNDFEELEFRFVNRGHMGLRDYLDPKEKIRRLFRYRDWWLYQLIKNKFILLRGEHSRASEIKNREVQPDATFSNETFYAIEKARMWIFETKNQERLKKLFARGAKVFLQIKAWCAARGVGLVFAIFPDQLQVDDHLRNRILEKYGLPPNSLDLTFPNQLLVQFFQKNQINYIDMRGEFQERGRTATLYRLNDTHWNESGNRLAADLFFHYLQAHGLGPVN